MQKLLWVALPLLAVLALLAAQLLRRRAPSRHTLNVWSSLLLAAYVLTTAGLGLFWVANQQLPVFDWHYLFGYITLLLVVLHLLFNFRIVWRHFTRGRPAEPTPQVDDGPPHRPLLPRRTLAVAGALLASGAAYLLGRRHGRPESGTQPVAAQNTVNAEASALALIERYHAMTSHSRAGVLLQAPTVNWGDAPPPFKPHAATAPRLALPVPGTAPGEPDSVASLSAVLWHTAGITETRGPLRLRASPSSGALFSTELYVAARSVAGLAPGLWHYDAATHTLVRWPGGVPTAEALGAASLHGAHATLIATAVFRRSGHKYRDRTYRYVLADLGHALENLRVAAAATGTQAHFIASFDESRAASTLGLDEGEEGVLALLAMLPASQALQPPEPPWQPLAAPSEHGAPLGVTSAMHRATSLRAAVPPTAASAAVMAPPVLPVQAIVLPPASPARKNVLELIATRRSVRRFAPIPLPLQALSGVLAGLAGNGTPPLSTALRVSVVAHAVAGLAPGAYRYEPARHALLPRRTPADLRAAAGAAALDQDVIRDAAAVFVLSLDRASVAADPTGPARGYRHAFLEAGRLGERIYLEAGAQGLGACAVGAFYDDEAAALVAIDPAHEWVLHFVALGARPAD